MNRGTSCIFRTVLLAVMAVGVSACDVTDPLEGVDLVLDIEDAPVELAGSSGTVSLEPGQTTSRSSNVSNPTDITSVQDLKTIKLAEADFSFQAAQAASGGPAGVASGPQAAPASGTVLLTVFINGVPVPGALVTVSIANDLVNNVAPESITVGSEEVDQERVRELLEALPPEDQPNLQDWENMSIDQVLAEINAGLASSSFPFVIVAKTTGDINGDLKLGQFSFSGRVVISQ